MCRAGAHPIHHVRPWLAPVMAGAAKRNQIGYGVRLGHRPRNDVVNVKPFALSVHLSLPLAAALASPAVTLTSSLGGQRPISTPAIVLRCAALPLRAVAAGKRACAGCRAARVAAKPARVTSKIGESLLAVFARSINASLPAPPVSVVAGHSAKHCRFGARQRGLKFQSAAKAAFGDLRLWLPLAALQAAVPSGATVRARAVMAAIFPAALAVEGFAALGAGVVNWLCHAETIARTRFKYNYFDIACRRVDEAARQPDLLIPETRQAPQQTGMDL